MKNYTFLIWAYYRLKGQKRLFELIDSLERSQWLAADLIREYQREKLREIIEYARTASGYYRDVFNAIGLETFTGIDDLKKIPILTKEIIRGNLGKMTAGRNDLLEYRTGGSTGIPLRFYVTKEYQDEIKMAANIRAYMQGGYRFGERIGCIWGYDHGLHEENPLVRLRNEAVFGNYRLNSFDMTDEAIGDFLRVIAAKKVRFIKGYASSLVRVARWIERNRPAFAGNVDAVFSEAERLDGAQRTTIETAFGARVFNCYGSREFGTIAVECSAHDGLHGNVEQLYIERTGDNRILVTSFFNKGTPFIRYETGDQAEALDETRCACGRSSCRIRNILGRISDNFVTKDGTIVHGEYVTHLFYEARAIEQFQMIQKAVDAFELKVVARGKEQAAEEIERIERKMQERFRSRLRIDVTYVDAIEQTRSGKHRFTISDIQP